MSSDRLGVRVQHDRLAAHCTDCGEFEIVSTFTGVPGAGVGSAAGVFKGGEPPTECPVCEAELEVFSDVG